MVQPAPQPFGVVATASTSGWSGSGITPPASGGGASGAFLGPHYVEEQSLTINYIRVPQGYGNSETLTLSSANANYTTLNTKLVCIVNATYSRKKVDAIFSTSSFQQPQKFEFLAVSADYQGSSYGDITASTLGPAGVIVTTQPWYYRRPWNDTTDTEVASSIQCANFALATSSDTGLISRSQLSNTANRYETFFIPPTYPFSFLSESDIYAYGNPGPGYWLPGPYNTSQESLVDIITFIDQIAGYLNNNSLYGIPATYGAGNYNLIRDAGLSYYESFRHDYS